MLAVALGAAVGAPLRFAVERRLASAYPWGTLLVNVAGSAVLGALAAWAAGRDAASVAVLAALVGTGFCGSVTTFGGYAAQVLDLAVNGGGRPRAARSARALGYASISIVLCVAVASAAYVLTRALVT
ncbi:MAG: fluoride efflux transporter CrcB [Frankiales bacterium]|nr:fluoride efflux transporter CrcB [Frankiales bacterium]